MSKPHTVAKAIEIASNWIANTNAPHSAAFIGGSIAYADPESAYDSASDIDCYLIVDGEPPVGKIGKIAVDGVLLDVSWVPWHQLQSAKDDAVLASLVHFGKVVRDDGKLGAFKDAIDANFSSDESVQARLESMRSKIRNGIGNPPDHNSPLPMAEQVMNWLFPATLATHIPLVQHCAPLTVRKRFLAAKKVMSKAAYEELLALYSFDAVTREEAQKWLESTALLLDATAALAKESSRFWATDIQSDARHIAIGGSQELIDSGLHREALYWILATSSRCLTVRADADVDSAMFLPGYQQMLKDLDLDSAESRWEKSRSILKWIK